jgi:hypothetical protein
MICGQYEVIIHIISYDIIVNFILKVNKDAKECQDSLYSPVMG